MKNLQIVFMGTPEFAVETLKEIISENFKVVGVVTAPDRPAGRGRKISVSPVKEFALEKEIPVLQPTNLKSEEFLSDLKSLQPNLQVVVAFRMLPKIVWQLPEYGTFNLHASLLPQYRGAAPINWALINGEKITGISTFFIDEKIDTGEMILQKEVSISEEENAGKLHHKLMKEGAKLVVHTLNEIQKGAVKTLLQPEIPFPKEAPKLNSENTKIDWNQSPTEIYNKIRGLSPYPGAWCFLQNGTDQLRCKIFKARTASENRHLSVGKIFLSGKELHIALKKGSIIVEEIQLPGKRKMKVNELLNGFIFKENAHMA
ncbi:MAG TPA: methionyl-tRNA formyltransferase [Flavobacteriaceae bacterium]|nr:methionyl-tRNA formyltransferase [Flavobacteriaceae bacterium]